MSGFRVRLLGVRGSTPAPGPSFLRYGGHTSCVAVEADQQQPALLLDAGTGARELGSLLSAPFDGTVVLTHLHWDHVQGLPFSDALLAPDATVRIVVPTDDDARRALLPGFSPPAFPVPVDELSAGWRFAAARSVQTVDSCTVRTAPVAHKGGFTIGIRVEHDGNAVVYMPDHDLSTPDLAARELAAGAELLLHDAQYLDDEIEHYRHYGHSTIEEACAFADSAEVGRLVLTHHGPDRNDAQLDAIAEQFHHTPDGRPVIVARQGDVLDVIPIHSHHTSSSRRQVPA